MTPTYKKDILLALIQETYVMLTRMGLREPANEVALMYNDTKNAPQDRMKQHYSLWCDCEAIIYKSLFKHSE